MRVTKKHKKLANALCKAYTFEDLNDKITIITAAHARDALPKISELKEDLLTLFTKEYTLKLRGGDLSPKGCLTVLKQLLRAFGKHLNSKRKYEYCKKRKRTISKFYYNII